METAETPFIRRALEVMRAGPFRRFIIGSCISDTGTWMQVMAQGWVMSALTNRAILLGAITAASGVPTILLTMFGGSVADRYDKRKILIIAQIAQMILAAILGTLVLLGVIKVWHIIALAACLGICISFEMPAISALVPELVRREQIATAIAIDRSVFHGSRLLGPSVAGLVITVIGAAAAFYANAVSFIALIIALITLPARTKGTAEEEEQRKSGFKEGLRYALHDRIMLCMFGLIALTTIFIFPFLSVMLPLYVRNILHLGADRMGYLMAISAIGSIVGSFMIVAIPPTRRFRFMSICAVVVVCALFGMSRSVSFYVTSVSMCVLAVALSTNFGLAATIVQERAPSPLRGRISAIFGLSFFGLQPVAGLLTPGFADLVGIPTALMVSSIIFGIGALIVLNRAGHQCDAPPGSDCPVAETQIAAAPVT